MLELNRWTTLVAGISPKESISMFIVTEYNTYADSVDALDSHVARCKFLVRSRRWYLILFWHFISLGVINPWLVYKRDCKLPEIAAKRVLKLREFQDEGSEALINLCTCRKTI